MPEIAEVARVVHHLRKSLVGKTLAVVKAQDDANVFGKVGTSGAEFQKALTGKKVLDAGRQGKYFWKGTLTFIFDPVLLMLQKANNDVASSSSVSFGDDRLDVYSGRANSPLSTKGIRRRRGMATEVGVFSGTRFPFLKFVKLPQFSRQASRVKDCQTLFLDPFFSSKTANLENIRYWKFTLETDSKPKVEVAFADARRFGRVRLVDCAAEDIRNTTPLKENGPDPTIDTDVLTEEWLEKKMKSKHVPVKALMLDQANISGIGNWVGDEILYHAKLHPEQYSDTFSSAQLKQLHKSILYVCQTAVDLLADSSKFPEEWLFKHRWGKGKKDSVTTLPNGAKITFVTVGGRTSCVVPSVQKKTGAVAGDVKKEIAEDAESEDGKPVAKKASKSHGTKKRKDVPKPEKLEVQDQVNGTSKKRKAANDGASKPSGQSSKVKDEVVEAPSQGRRRSGRASKVRV